MNLDKKLKITKLFIFKFFEVIEVEVTIRGHDNRIICRVARDVEGLFAEVDVVGDLCRFTRFHIMLYGILSKV